MGRLSTEVVKGLEALVEEIARGQGLVVYDFGMAMDRGRSVLRVIVDRPTPRVAGEGVTVKQCAKVSRELSARLEEDDPIGVAYLLEVSSPGVERALERARHFAHAVGEKVLLTLVNPPPGPNPLQGFLEGFDEESSMLRVRVCPPRKKVKKGQQASVEPIERWVLMEFPLSAIRKARTTYDFD